MENMSDEGAEMDGADFKVRGIMPPVNRTIQ